MLRGRWGLSRGRSTDTVLALALLLTIGIAPASAYVIDNCITNNNADSCNTTVGAQFVLTVSDAGNDQVDFKFENIGNIASSITQIYFDDGTLLGIASIIPSGSGVDFSQNATPPDLPGGNNASPPFVTTVGFSAGADAPVASNGVNNSGAVDPDEYLIIRFGLENGQDLADTLDALADGSLRVGIHVQAITNGTAAGISEAFICCGGGGNGGGGGSPAPVPATLALLGAGLLTAAGFGSAWGFRKKK